MIPTIVLNQLIELAIYNETEGITLSERQLVAASSHPESTYALPRRRTRWASRVN